MCLSLHCHHQTDSYIRTGSDESHLNVSLIVRGKVTSQCPQTTTFEEKGEPKRIRTEVPLLPSLTPNRLAKAAHKVLVYNPPLLPCIFSFDFMVYWHGNCSVLSLLFIFFPLFLSCIGTIMTL